MDNNIDNNITEPNMDIPQIDPDLSQIDEDLTEKEIDDITGQESDNEDSSINTADENVDENEEDVNDNEELKRINALKKIKKNASKKRQNLPQNFSYENDIPNFVGRSSDDIKKQNDVMAIDKNYENANTEFSATNNIDITPVTNTDFIDGPSSDDIKKQKIDKNYENANTAFPAINNVDITPVANTDNTVYIPSDLAESSIISYAIEGKKTDLPDKINFVRSNFEGLNNMDGFSSDKIFSPNVSMQVSSNNTNRAVEKNIENQKQTETDIKQESQVQRSFSASINGNNFMAVTRLAATEFINLSGVNDSNDEASLEAVHKAKAKYNELSNILDDIGSRSVYNAMVAYSDRTQSMAAKTEALIGSKKISLHDLKTLDKASIINTLTDSGVSDRVSRNIAKNSDLYVSVITAKAELSNFAQKNKNLFDEKEIALLTGGSEFFNFARHGDDVKKIANKYFKNSENIALRELNPAKLTSKDLKKLLKQGDKFISNPSDKYVIKMLCNLKKTQEKMRDGIGIIGLKGVKKISSKVIRKAASLDSDAGAGLQKGLSFIDHIRTAKMVTKFAVKVTGVEWAAKQVKNVMGRKISTMADIKKAKYQETNVHKIAQKAKATIENTKPVKKAKKVSTKFNKIKGNITNKAQAIKKPLDFVFEPFRKVATAFSQIKKVIGTILFWISAALLVFIIFYLVLQYAVDAIVHFAQFLTDTTSSTIMTEDVPTYITDLNKKDDEKYAEAKKNAKGKPQNSEVHNGQTIYHYGSPQTADDPNAAMYHNDIPGSKTTNGTHIYYLDSDGDVIGNNTTNTKDIICLSSVMIDNNYDDDSAIAESLMDKWFDYLNPAVYYTESDIYDTDNSSDKYPYDGITSNGTKYYCNDKDFYENYKKAKANGVVFYDDPAEETDEGCETRIVEEPVDADGDGDPDRDDEGNIITEEKEEKYCPGHDALHCSYGYKDINIYVTILTKDDVYNAYHGGNGVITYRVPSDYKCTGWITKTVTLDFSAYQFKDFDGWDKTENDEWCDKLYDTDWYDIYGMDAYSNSVGLEDGQQGTEITDAQAAEIVSNATAKYGSFSEARQQFVTFATSYVGKISYYWGGNASVQGFDGNNFGARIKPDYMGRNIKGLDCSGFVRWCYWTIFDKDPAPGTAYLTNSLGLERISYNNLQPGDLGLEDLPGAKKNHIGIFVGYSDSGKALWCHCTGDPINTVVLNTKNNFKYYYSLGR